MRCSGTVERTAGDGTFGLSASTVSEYTINDAQFTAENPYNFEIYISKSDSEGQQFKRRGGNLSVLLSKCSFREVLKEA